MQSDAFFSFKVGHTEQIKVAHISSKQSDQLLNTEICLVYLRQLFYWMYEPAPSCDRKETPEIKPIIWCYYLSLLVNSWRLVWCWKSNRCRSSSARKLFCICVSLSFVRLSFDRLRKKMILQQPAERHAFTHHFTKSCNWKINNAQNSEIIVAQWQLGVQGTFQN